LYALIGKRTGKSDRGFRDPSFDSNDYLDLRARPRFLYRPAEVLERVEPDLAQWGVLIAFNLIFFAAAFVSFERYDVR
jgi:hypothetical protein